MIEEYEERDRQTKHLLRWGIVAILLMVALILASARFRKYRVLGNTRYTDAEVVNMIFSDPWDTNSFYQWIKEKTKPHKQLPFIEQYKLTWTSPLSVEIVIYEKNVVGYVNYMSSRMYFDKDGIIVESTEESLDGIPEITGLSFGSIVLYKELPVENKKVFNDILNLTGSLQSYQIACDEIAYDELLNATLKIGDITVTLGQNTDMEMKISTRNDILPKLSGKKGTLDLCDYSENMEKETYIFKEKS